MFVLQTVTSVRLQIASEEEEEGGMDTQRWVSINGYINLFIYSHALTHSFISRSFALTSQRAPTPTHTFALAFVSHIKLIF